jgi:hypothetical protein
MLRSAGLLVLILFIASCASIKAPPGGEEDKTPPQIDTTFPAPGQLNVSRTPRIRFSFKHNIDRTSMTQSVTMTPYMSGQVKFDWSGYDEVELQLPDTLRANTTYIVTISKTLKTERAGTLAEPYQLIFSTGNQIDTGMLSGQILPALTTGAPPDLKNVSVFAYDISILDPDTLHLNLVRPDYLTEPSNDGKFSLRALKVGHKYRFLAVVDEFRNKVYDEGIDAYGMPAGDVLLDQPNLTGISMRMMPKIDTAKPQLQDYEVIDAYHIKARFTKTLDSASIRPQGFILRDSISGAVIPIIATYRENIDKKGGLVTLLVDKLAPGKTYALQAVPSFITDLSKTHLDSLKSLLSVVTTDIRDTFAVPKFSGLGFFDSTRGFAPEFDLLVSFTDAVDTVAFKSGLQLTDSTGKQIQYSINWIDGIRARIKASLLPKAFYRFAVSQSSIKSPVATSWAKVKDTTIITGFFTGEVTEFGTVSGEILISDSILHSGHIVIRLVNEDGKVERMVQLPNGVKTYQFDKIAKGKYRVQAWLTNRSDGEYEGGKPIPLRFALPSGDYPDLIDVRPKWTVEHVDITLR